MWRRNRRDNGDPECFGVDLNRNFDWIWDFRTALSANAPYDVATYCQGSFAVSDDVCDPADTYHGPKPFSEPETRNVRRVLDENPHVRVFVDVHGVLGKVMTPWADDQVQTTDPEQNFANAGFDGVRGLTDALAPTATCQAQTLDSDGPAYREFMHAVDQSRYALYAKVQQDAIASVRGAQYRTGTSYVEMYGMSGNANDYAHSRHAANPAAAKIDGYIYEFENVASLGFQPPFEEPPGPNDMIHVVRDVTAGLLGLLLAVDRIPFVETSPARVGFGRVRVGTTAQRGIAVINRGTQNVALGPVSMLGNAGPFAVTNISQKQLAPN
jgi:hypothetical protein